MKIPFAKILTIVGGKTRNKIIFNRQLTLLLALLVIIGSGCTSIRGSNHRPALAGSDNVVPQSRSRMWNTNSAYADQINELWAHTPPGDWYSKGKGDSPRVLLARMTTRYQIEEVNDYLLGIKPWGTSGSTWSRHPKGDYDFTITVLTSLLWLYGADESRLHAATREHLLKVLLTEDGNAFRSSAPETLGLVSETENHLLMTEGSRYLKNRWLQLHGDPNPRYDNVANSMEKKIRSLISEMQTAGFYEFTSQPYIGYTITALLNLEAFASVPVRASARELLDQMNWHYALGSYQLRHFPPFRRRYEYARTTALNSGYQTVFMNAWLSFAPDGFKTPGRGSDNVTHALMGVTLPYRPSDEVVKMIYDKGDGYFALLGHGRAACPEIYSAGKKFLLSAGGANRGEGSIIVARPITLLLDDGADDLSQVFHLAGPGTNFMAWNNTGVHKNFAVAAGPVYVPARFTALQTNGSWKLYAPTPGVFVAVYSRADFGLLAVFERASADNILTSLVVANPDETQLKHTFQFPNAAKFTYDVMSPKDKWVMISAGEKKLNRNFDNWPVGKIE